MSETPQPGPITEAQQLDRYPDIVQDEAKALEMAYESKPLIDQLAATRKNIALQERLVQQDREQGERPDYGSLEKYTDTARDLTKRIDIVQSTTGVLYDTEKFKREMAASRTPKQVGRVGLKGIFGRK